MKLAAEKYWVVAAICLALAVITFAIFGQTRRFDFVNYDDDACVYENPIVAQGLTTAGVIKGFGHFHYGNWIPLTVVSHMADCQIYGLNAGGHHLTNVLIHTASVITLFLLLLRTTGALWRSAFVAAVFAVHPLRVESVAWVTERKDVLSGLFFMLTLWAYVHYVRRPKSLFNYLIVVCLFALGLLAKPMLVTLPFILLLLDYWPLQRIRNSEFGIRSWLKLLVEKIPLLILSAACCVMTVLVLSRAVQPLKALPLSLRVENAVVSCAAYIGQLFYPTNLAVLYPYPITGLPILEIIAAGIMLAAISMGAFLWRRKYPYLLVGWLWYLVMLAPVIGLVQAGVQARADRYTYLPQIGLCLMLAWLVNQASARLPHRRVILGTGATLVLVALVAMAHAQTKYWRDSESLWTHTLACTENNSIAHNNLGLFLSQKGRVDEAIGHFHAALAINPDMDSTENNLGLALVKQNQVDEAAGHFQKAVAINPDNDDAQNNLGNIFFMNGQMDEAMVHYRKALEANPSYAKAENNLGLALARKGQIDEAIVHFQKAVAIDLGYAEASRNLQFALAQKGQAH